MPSGLRVGPFDIDVTARRLTRDGAMIPIPDRALDVLLCLAATPRAVVPKETLVTAAWPDVAVTDNSLEQAISILRRALGPSPDGSPLIENVPRRGYRLAADVSVVTPRRSDDELAAILAPHQAWLDGRTALESLTRAQAASARATFARVLSTSPDHAPAHLGLANARVFAFEATRADACPDIASLHAAGAHAREACRLAADWGEAWATLAFTLHRLDPQQAAAAARRAVTLEPDNWRHHLRLAYVSWGEERLRAAARTLTLLPGQAMAHWLVATVHVARQGLDAAATALEASGAAQDAQADGDRFATVGAHWLRGLVRLRQGDRRTAREAFERELTFERAGHIYAREACAAAWCALGALALRDRDAVRANAAFDQALTRIPELPLALAGRLSASPAERPAIAPVLAARLDALRALGAATDAAIVDAVRLTAVGGSAQAAAAVLDALRQAHRGSAGWSLPVDPLLDTTGPEWAPVLALLGSRAA